MAREHAVPQGRWSPFGEDDDTVALRGVCRHGETLTDTRVRGRDPVASASGGGTAARDAGTTAVPSRELFVIA